MGEIISIIGVENLDICMGEKGFPGGSDNKESACNAGDWDSIPGSGRSSGGGHSNPLHYSCLENSMERAVLQAIVHGFERVRQDICSPILIMTLITIANTWKYLSIHQ